MHSQNFALESPPSHDQPDSEYMIVLNSILDTFRNHHLILFSHTQADSALILELLQDMVSTSIDAFITHVCLIRPLSEFGRLRLAADMAQFELALSQFCDIQHIGVHYDRLRALRRLIFVDTEKLLSPEAHVIFELLPARHILHHLFSRGPDELQSPHSRLRWEMPQYLQWLHSHSDQQIWTLMRESLDAYAKLVNQRGDREFTVVYPIIIAVAERLHIIDVQS